MKLFRWFQERWKLKNIRQVMIILIIFTCAGFTILFLKKPVLEILDPGGDNLWFDVLYFILIWPIYNLVLLFYGFIFGQFSFFWEFEKKMFRRITGRR